MYTIGTESVDILRYDVKSVTIVYPEEGLLFWLPPLI